jgi:hypothetical protein
MIDRIIFILACIFTFNLSVSAQNKSENITAVNVLDDFESESGTIKWDGPAEVTSEFHAHGKNSLSLYSPKGESVWLESKNIDGDWHKFEYFKFDIYNPSQKLYFGNIQLSDNAGSGENEEFNGETYRGEKIFVNSGWNHYEFNIQNARVENGSRFLNTQHIRKLRFSFGSVANPLYLDNLRLVSGIESPQSASLTNPADCKVIIDDRYVYPSLYGPVDMVKYSTDLIQLRNDAVSEVEKLKAEIHIAEMQGIQTLYQRIPLITAEVGLGIRSKLVWFQNEQEQTKILKHIIKSCSEASKSIQVNIAGRQTNILFSEPENDVSNQSSYQSLYIPSYPQFKNLKIKDGYYRDNKNNPLMVLSLLQLNSGPLMDYFAPFNHRIESYTVGGGSRYDIEYSPVYKAFHKFPDTHRVGWDGWCGHLIKDQWSMGGKKENVVICLESLHTREAILEYIKIHHEEWLNNPDLLYNIMAYELQYICYCEKSQQMFREWLKAKYKTLTLLNKSWKTDYHSYNELQAPKTLNGRPLNDVNRAAWYDWASFNTRRFTDYLKWVKAEMKKYDPHTSICAGGTSSMLNSANSVTGIDEEMIINEVDDIILNESGDSPIFSDLLLSLSENKKLMVDPELGGDTHGLLLQFLHGKSDISKWWWSSTPSLEYPEMNQSSIPYSKVISLADIDEILHLSLDIRRLSSEIAAFATNKPEIAILYSKTSIIQVPPKEIPAGRTPYLDALYSTWEGSRFLGCRVGFISEKQILAGNLDKYKLLIIPAAKYMNPDVIKGVENYIKKGGTAVIIPETFTFNQFAGKNNKISELGITITEVNYPNIVGSGEKEQNYDQSFSQKVLYSQTEKKIETLSEDIFKDASKPMTFVSNGLVQTIGPGNYKVLAKFDDQKPAIIKSSIANGSLYYLASPLKSNDYHLLFSSLVKGLGLKRPILGIDKNGNLITDVEIRSVERNDDILVYASNLKAEPVHFSLVGDTKLETIQNLRTLTKIPAEDITLEPFQETIFRVEKKITK